MKWWAVYIASGAVQQVVEIGGKAAEHWEHMECVRADTKEQAKRRGYTAYCAKKKKTAIDRLEKEGRCRCGRHNDRADDGLKTCTICGMRRKATQEQRQARAAQGKTIVRDEGARIEANLARQRDRKSEMRLEVLVEVQRAWQNHRTVGDFTRWLDKEIDECLKPKIAAE